ncbi:hypothetical protein ANN_03594 [Periplaneta americana]|uniref:Uncharacterized protein n=1 Tax=Periplaneta americana TaxID=6978 RepID=A0ABQ8U0K7_PERAM|nr:hypothetical protein ANN_03594 [Periplaneta americana]
MPSSHLTFGLPLRLLPPGSYWRTLMAGLEPACGAWSNLICFSAASEMDSQRVFPRLPHYLYGSSILNGTVPTCLQHQDVYSGRLYTHSADKNSMKHATVRVLLFQTIAPGIPLPPQPVLTCWETWFDAVNYYAEHYGKIMEVVDELDSTDSSAIAAVKSLPSEQLSEDILFIDSNFKIVSKSITLLESSKLQLSEALNIVDKDIETFDLEDFKYNFVNMTAFRIVDAEDVGVREILKDMERFQPVGHSILNKSRIIQKYMVSRETLRRYATRRSETNTNRTEFDSSE